MSAGSSSSNCFSNHCSHSRSSPLSRSNNLNILSSAVQVKNYIHTQFKKTTFLGETLEFLFQN